MGGINHVDELTEAISRQELIRELLFLHGVSNGGILL